MSVVPNDIIHDNIYTIYVSHIFGYVYKFAKFIWFFCAYIILYVFNICTYGTWISVLEIQITF